MSEQDVDTGLATADRAAATPRRIHVLLRRPLRRAVALAITMGALAAAAMRADVIGIERAASHLPLLTLVIIGVALSAGMAFACLRLQFVAQDLGAGIRFRDTLVATTAGVLGGALFFSIFGQVLARSAVLSKSGV